MAYGYKHKTRVRELIDEMISHGAKSARCVETFRSLQRYQLLGSKLTFPSNKNGRKMRQLAVLKENFGNVNIYSLTSTYHGGISIVRKIEFQIRPDLRYTAIETSRKVV